MLSPRSLDVGARPETEGARKSPEEKKGQRKGRKNVRGDLDTKSRRHQRLRDGAARIAPLVSRHVVVDRPENRERRDREVEATQGSEAFAKNPEEVRFVPLVLEHVEESRGPERAGPEARVRRRRTHNGAKTARPAVPGPGGTRLDKNGCPARLLEPACHEPIASADIEDRAARWMTPDQFIHATAAVSKPEGTLFDTGAPFVPRVRIGHRRTGLRHPEAWLGLLEIRREAREVDHDGIGGFDPIEIQVSRRLDAGGASLHNPEKNRS